jgi:hypothetical protein
MNAALQTDVGLTDAIFHRRAVRHYGAREVDAETVQKLLLAAVQAPSAMNQQPWVFAVFHGRKRLLDYSERAKRHLVSTFPTTFELHSRSELYEDSSYDLFHGASTLIVIYATAGRLNPNEDCCLAAENLMLAAYGMGLARSHRDEARARGPGALQRGFSCGRRIPGGCHGTDVAECPERSQLEMGRGVTVPPAHVP